MHLAPAAAALACSAKRCVSNTLDARQIVVMDSLYKDKPFARFFVLETIARVPYFGEEPPLPRPGLGLPFSRQLPCSAALAPSGSLMCPRRDAQHTRPSCTSTRRSG